MTKVTYYEQREDFGEFLFRVLTKAMTYLLFSILTILIFVMQKENKEIEARIETFPEYSVTTERIPVKELMSDYIDTLPIPKVEILNTKVIEQEEQITQDIQILPELENKVKGIIPSVKTFNTSAYCACEKCCGKTDGITASGDKASQWCTIAAGKEYELGTIIYIPALSDKPNKGWFIVQDRGGAISDDRLDVYMTSHQGALEYGRKNLEAYVYEIN